MLALRPAHEAGPTCITINGDHVITGGVDGVVALFPVKRWPQSSSLWARQCHEGGVTAVALYDQLHIALSCGRDGKVVLHENVHDTSSSTSRVICRITGEVRCLHFDTERRRIFVGGDSLRCLRMSGSRFDIHTIPLAVPHPLVAIALSPCGALLAMASASGAVGVVCSVPSSASTAESQDPASATATQSGWDEQASVYEKYKSVRFSFPNVLSPTAKRADGCTYRMQWCRTAGGLFLCVPMFTEAVVYKLDDSDSNKITMRSVGGLHCGDLNDLSAVACYPLTMHRMMCVMASAKGLFVAKVDDKKLSMSRHTSQMYGESDITDMYVNEKTGDITVGLANGQVSLLHRAALKAFDAAKSSSQKKEPKSEKKDRRPETIDNNNNNIPTKPQTTQSAQDDGFINDADSASGSEDEFRSSSSSSLSSEDDNESDASMSENFEEVVSDLKRTNAGYIDEENEHDRPSRWRSDDVSGAMLIAEREAQRHKSRFLDDEAEEADDGDAESEDAAAFEDDGYGERRADEYDEEADDMNGDEVHSIVSDDDCAGAAASPRLMATGAAAVVDYSFQVGATPAGDEGSSYLAYNSVGYIHATRDSTTVYFHDISNPAVRIYEKGTVIMGTLSPVGAGFLLAPPDDAAMGESVDETPRLVLYFRTFVALGAQSEWRVRLQPGETVRSMAAGIRYFAVATTRYLRIFSLSGLELAVLTKHPHVVTLIGTSSRKLMSSFKAEFDPLAVFYLEGGELKMEIMDVGSRSSVITSQSVPLTELPDGTSHQLQWVGWSDDGPLHTADTAGVVRMHTQNWGGSWVPLFDPRQQTDQSTNLWVWGVNDESLCAYRSSKSDSPYPAAVAGGLPTEHVPLFLPLTRAAHEKDTIAWDHLLRRETRTDEIKRQSNFYSATIAKHDALHDKKILELFTSALNDQLTTRALDLATMLELRDNVELCAKEANSKGHMQLVHKLLAIYEMRVKTKQKRKCLLPLEGAMVSEKERDALLRKMLAREKSGGSAAVDGKEGSTAQVTMTSPSPAAAVLQQSASRSEKAISGASPSPLGSVSPSKSEATTATTMATGMTSPERGRITFDLPPPSTSQTAMAATTAAATSPAKPSNPFAKPSNPFAKKPANPTPAPAASANGQVMETNISSSTGGSGKLGKGVSPPRPAASRTSQTLVGSPITQIEKDKDAEVLILGEAGEEFPALGSTVTAATPQRTAAAPETDISAAEGTASPSSAIAGRPSAATATRPSADGGFVPKALPVALPRAPVDPFLAPSTAAESVPSLTVDEVLVDVGHENSEMLPRSASFGEALRKRYREDVGDGAEDDDEEGDGIAVPLTAIPRIF